MLAPDLQLLYSNTTFCANMFAGFIRVYVYGFFFVVVFF